ncbi:MAG TPA: hypothetical protein PL066_01180 [bacterium]|nr:hypothetical protein [bacterium]
MSDGNKKQRHQFLDYLEDYKGIKEEKKLEEQEESNWKAEANVKQEQQNRFLVWVYVLSGVFVLLIVVFWWNISRANFYKALSNPVQDEVFQEFLNLIDNAKESGPEAMDWRAELQNMETENLSTEEQETLKILQDKVDSGAELSEIINELK